MYRSICADIIDILGFVESETDKVLYERKDHQNHVNLQYQRKGRSTPIHNGEERDAINLNSPQ